MFTLGESLWVKITVPLTSDVSVGRSTAIARVGAAASSSVCRTSAVVHATANAATLIGSVPTMLAVGFMTSPLYTLLA